MPAGKKVEQHLYERAFKQAVAELEQAMAERDALDEALETADKKISRLRRGASGLGALCGKGPYTLSSEFPELFPDLSKPDTGLTDAIRDVLRSDLMYYSAIRVRDTLKEKGYDVSKYKNALASIHTVLRRLKSQDEVKEMTHEGRVMYRWIKKESDPPTDDADDIPF